MRNLLLCATLLASNFSLSPLSLALDVGGAAGGAKGAVGGAVGGAAGAVGGAVGGAAGAVGGAVGGAAGAVGGAVGGAAGAVGGAVGGAAGAVGGAVGGAAGAVGGAVGAVGGVATGAAGSVGNVARGATSTAGRAVGTATGALGGTTAAVGQAVATGTSSTRSTATSPSAGAFMVPTARRPTLRPVHPALCRSRSANSPRWSICRWRGFIVASPRGYANSWSGSTPSCCVRCVPAADRYWRYRKASPMSMSRSAGSRAPFRGPVFKTLIACVLAASESGRRQRKRAPTCSVPQRRERAPSTPLHQSASPSRKSMARLVLPSRLELKSPEGSANEAPLANVIFTTLLYVSPVQISPACDHTGTPLHFHSSTTSGSACLMRLRRRASISPRQSPSSLILASISCEGEAPLFHPSSQSSSSSCLSLPSCCSHLRRAIGWLASPSRRTASSSSCVVLMDVEVARVLALGLAGRDRIERRAAEERHLDVLREAMDAEEPAMPSTP